MGRSPEMSSARRPSRSGRSLPRSWAASRCRRHWRGRTLTRPPDRRSKPSGSCRVSTARAPLADDGRAASTLTARRGGRAKADAKFSASVARSDEADFTLDGRTQVETRLVAAYTDTDGTEPPSGIARDRGRARRRGRAVLKVEVDLTDVVFALAADDGPGRAPSSRWTWRISSSQGLPLVGAVLGDAAGVEDVKVVAATATPVAGSGARPRRRRGLEPPAAGPSAKPLPSHRIDRGVGDVREDEAGPAADGVALGPRPPPAAGAQGGGGAASRRPADGTKWFPVQRSLRAGVRRPRRRPVRGRHPLVAAGRLAVPGRPVGLPLGAWGSARRSPRSSRRSTSTGWGWAFSAGPGGDRRRVPRRAERRKWARSVVPVRRGGGRPRRASFTLSAVGSYAELDRPPVAVPVRRARHAAGRAAGLLRHRADGRLRVQPRVPDPRPGRGLRVPVRRRGSTRGTGRRHADWGARGARGRGDGEGHSVADARGWASTGSRSG